MFDAALLFRTQLKPVRTNVEPGKPNWRLPEEAALPDLGQTLSGQSNFARLRLAISDKALLMTAEVRGKRQLPWCRESRLEDSDGLHIWIDTRNSRGVHRATRYCHRFIFAPMGRGAKNERPFASWAPINRARENSQPPSEKQLDVQSTLRGVDYDISAAITWSALTGFDSKDFPVIGFYAAVVDRELGWQSLGLSPPYPVAEDPSLWLELSL